MDIKDFLKEMTAEEKQKFANRAGTSTAYLSQLANGHRRAGAKSMSSIARASGGKVTPHDLRPDLYPARDVLGGM